MYKRLHIRYILMPVAIAINTNDTCHLLSVVCPVKSSTKGPPKKTSKKSVPARKAFSFNFPSFKGHCSALCPATLFNRFVLPNLSCSVRRRRKVGWIICVCMSDKAIGAPISMCIPEYHPRTGDELGSNHRERLCARPHAL